MFSPQIVESEEFLSMPISSQALYFHLGMNADDDGFIQPKLTMRQVGSTDDDLKVLLTKRFLLVFDGGVVVIKHWLIHNLIQKDRYHPTRFLDQKKRLFVKENKAYTETTDSVNKMLPEVRSDQVRSGQIRLDQETKDSRATRRGKKPVFTTLGAEVLKAFEAIDPKNKTYYSNTTQRGACDFLVVEYGLEKVKQAITMLPQINQQKLYIRQITTPHELKENWVKIGNALRQKKLTNKFKVAFV